MALDAVSEAPCRTCPCCLPLLSKINLLEQKLASLATTASKVSVYQNEVHGQDSDQSKPCGTAYASPKSSAASFRKCSLTGRAIERYSRQIILSELGVSGQIALNSANVLIIGAGGLGCPAALYLATSGVGHIGLVDYDTVDLSNLQRQVLHLESSVGVGKVESAIQGLNKINSDVKYTCHSVALSSKNATEIISQYDVVLDCSDNVPSRYLINDACVLNGKPLVSGSALRFEGQLTVYNHGGAPCYRCLYPEPPPPESITNCSDAGVIGPVTGVIGALQALEAIRLITRGSSSFAGRLLLFDGLTGSFRSIKLRAQSASCRVCGASPDIVRLQDYEQFCGVAATEKALSRHVLSREERVSAREYADSFKNSSAQVLIDVRPEIEFEMCSLNDSTNFPMKDMLNPANEDSIMELIAGKQAVFVVCRRGNDSQIAVNRIKQILSKRKNVSGLEVRDLIGGLCAWQREVETDFPIY